MSWSTSELRVRLADLSPPVKYFNLPLQGGTSFVDHLCCLCLVFAMLSRLFMAALWSPEGKGLASWLLFVMFIVVLLLSHLVSLDRCGTWLYCFLIFDVFLTFMHSDLELLNVDYSFKVNICASTRNFCVNDIIELPTLICQIKVHKLENINKFMNNLDIQFFFTLWTWQIQDILLVLSFWLQGMSFRCYY